MPNGTITEYVNKNPKANRIALASLSLTITTYAADGAIFLKLLDVAEGLAYLHGMRIAHADLKGVGNLLWSTFG